MLQIFFPEQNTLPFMSKKLFSEYPSIKSDPDIHSGWPHIRGTRILASDVLRAQIQGYSIEAMRMQFQEMGVSVKNEALTEACRFTIEWMHILNEKEASKAAR